MTESQIPEHLASTVALIRRAFPEGLTSELYLATLVILYPHMSDENLAEVATIVTGRDRGQTLNDVYSAGEGGDRIPVETLRRAQTELSAVGLDRWLLED